MQSAARSDGHIELPGGEVLSDPRLVNADLAPTEPEKQVYELLSGRLADTKKKFDELYEKTIPAWNEAMRAKGYIQLMDVKEPEEPPEPAPDEPDEDGGD